MRRASSLCGVASATVMVSMRLTTRMTRSSSLKLAVTPVLTAFLKMTYSSSIRRRCKTGAQPRQPGLLYSPIQVKVCRAGHYRPWAFDTGLWALGGKHMSRHPAATLNAQEEDAYLSLQLATNLPPPSLNPTFHVLLPCALHHALDPTP